MFTVFTIKHRYVFCEIAPLKSKKEVKNNMLPITIKRIGYLDISAAAILLIYAFRLGQGLRLRLKCQIFTHEFGVNVDFLINDHPSCNQRHSNELRMGNYKRKI